MRIFITGASGFVGGAAAKKLKDQHEIFALARSESSAQKIRSLGAIPVMADLLSLQPKHLRGIDVVIHCAALAEDWGSRTEFYETNVVGTSKMLEAAKEAGVKRFIFIGTEAAFFNGDDLMNIDESIKYPIHTPYLYSLTKGEAEKIVLTANSSDFTTISLRPRLVWGPEDQSILPTLIEMIEQNKFAWIGSGRYQTSTTHIDNLVHAIEQALFLGKGGEAYFVADEGSVLMKEFLSAALATKGIIAPDKSIPKFVARLAARVTEWFWLTANLRTKPPLIRFSIDMMSSNCTLNTAKAKTELAYSPPISREEGLRLMTSVHSKVPKT